MLLVITHYNISVVGERSDERQPVRRDRAKADHAFEESLETQMELEAQAIAATGHSEDFRAGVTAFAKKLGAPIFSGR